LRSRKGKNDLGAVLLELGRRQILSVLLESGPALNGSALQAALVDRMFLFYATKLAGHSRTPFATNGKPSDIRFHQKIFHEFGADFAIDALLRDHFDR